MDLVKRLFNLERLFPNLMHSGKVAAVSGDLAKVEIKGQNNQATLTPLLPVMGREGVALGEPVVVLFPNADFIYGFIICDLPDPQIDELSERLQQTENRLESVENQIQRLEQQFNN